MMNHDSEGSLFGCASVVTDRSVARAQATAAPADIGVDAGPLPEPVRASATARLKVSPSSSLTRAAETMAARAPVATSNSLTTPSNRFVSS